MGIIESGLFAMGYTMVTVSLHCIVNKKASEKFFYHVLGLITSFAVLATAGEYVGLLDNNKQYWWYCIGYGFGTFIYNPQAIFFKYIAVRYGLDDIRFLGKKRK